MLKKLLILLIKNEGRKLFENQKQKPKSKFKSIKIFKDFFASYIGNIGKLYVTC